MDRIRKSIALVGSDRANTPATEDPDIASGSSAIRTISCEGSTLLAGPDRETAAGAKSNAVQTIEVGHVEPFLEKPNGFLVKASLGSDVWFCYAESDVELQKWVSSLQQAQTSTQLITSSTLRDAEAGDPVTYQGYLRKQGHRRKNWKRRFFVLKGAILSYYENSEKYRLGAKPKKTVTVSKVRDYSEFAPSSEWQAFSFTFITTDGEPYYVCAENSKLRQRWISALELGRLSLLGVRCDACRALVKLNQKFCGICGAKVTNLPAADTASFAQAGSPEVIPGGVAGGQAPGVSGAFGNIRSTISGRRTSALGTPTEDTASRVTRRTINMGRSADDFDFRHRQANAPRRKAGASSSDIPAVSTLPVAYRSTRRTVSDKEIPPVIGYRGTVVNANGYDDPEVPTQHVKNLETDLGSQDLQPDSSDANLVPADEGEALDLSPVDRENEWEDTGGQELSEGARTLLLAVLNTPEVGEGTRSIVANDITNELAETIIDEEESIRRRNEAGSQTQGNPLQNGGFVKQTGGILPAAKWNGTPSVAISKDPSIDGKSNVLSDDEEAFKDIRASYGADGRDDHGLGESSEEHEDIVDNLPPHTTQDFESNFLALGRNKPRRQDAFVNGEARNVLNKEEVMHTPMGVLVATGPEFSRESLTSPTVARQESPRQLDVLYLEDSQTGMRKKPLGSPTDVATANIYAALEHEFGLRPAFVPADNPFLRCRIYCSPDIMTAARVLVLLPDSGSLGMWRQENANGVTSSQSHPFSMYSFIAQGLQANFAILITNPYTNTAKVQETTGEERVVPLPQTSTPEDHVRYLWKNYLSVCHGSVSFVAYGRGGELFKSLLVEFEVSLRMRLHRAALIESRHVVDESESYSVRQLLAKKAINWESSATEVATQLQQEQARVGCVCLSAQTGGAPYFSPLTLEAAKASIFAFMDTDPNESSMTAIVKAIRLVVRIRSRMPSNVPPAAKSAELPQSLQPPQHAGAYTELQANDLTSGKYGLASQSEKLDSMTTANYAAVSGSAKGVADTKEDDEEDSISLSVDKDFDLKEVIGQGGFGRVLLVRKKTGADANTVYAMKILLKKSILSSGLVKTTMAERRILTEINHPFIVRLHYAFQNETKLYLVMDYMSGGSLNVHLRKWRKFPEAMARFYAAEIALAIHHLHTVNIIYRDAKLENVLMDAVGHVAISDFGLSKIGVSGLRGAKTFCGTAAYIAPELLKGEAYGKAADWWSFGILLYEMIAGRPPYYHKNREVMFETILKQDWVTFSAFFSDAAVDIIQGVRTLLNRDPLRRLAGNKVFRHRFFQNMDWEELLAKRVKPPYDPEVRIDEVAFVPKHILQQPVREPSAGPEARRQVLQDPKSQTAFEGFSFSRKPNFTPVISPPFSTPKVSNSGRMSSADRSPHDLGYQQQRSPPRRSLQNQDKLR